MEPYRAAVAKTWDISLRLSQKDCMNNDSHNSCTHITCYEVFLLQNEDHAIGSIQCQLLHKAGMDAIGLNTMWDECQAYNTSHAPESKLDKVENYLANGCFLPEKQTLIDKAEYILFIEEVYVDSEYRGRGISLLGMELLIAELGVGERCVVLLQAAPLVQVIRTDSQAGDGCAVTAHERIARHWKRMGFEKWSWTDDAWLCLSTAPDERPKIEDIFSRSSGSEISPAT